MWISGIIIYHFLTKEKQLIQSEKYFQTTVDTRETHEGKTQQSGREHDNSHALHALGNLYQFQLLTKTVRASPKPRAVEKA